MSSDLFGFGNSLLHETSQDHLLFETAPEIADNFLIQVINESSSWEQIASLLPQESELELRDAAAMEVKREECQLQRKYCQNEQIFVGPHFDRVLESARNQFLGLPESICGSNGDLQVGKYSKEERKRRIDRYRAKRSRRNFNKTIKYACRKTLADGRQRIRGRFARNHEILQPSLFQTCPLWVDDWLVSRRRS